MGRCSVLFWLYIGSATFLKMPLLETISFWFVSVFFLHSDILFAVHVSSTKCPLVHSAGHPLSLSFNQHLQWA